MKNYIKAFTLSEVLIVIAIIGVIAAFTIPQLGSKVDKNKGLFKKAYSVAERNVAELVNDEIYYRYDFNKPGFKETSDVLIPGADCFTSTVDYKQPAKTAKKSAEFNNDLVKFCNLFSNSLNLNGNPVFSPANLNASRCNFTTNDGVEWEVTNTEEEGKRGFLVKIDTNGTKSPNMPKLMNGSLLVVDSNGSASKTDGNIKNRDIYYFYVRYDGKMFLPDDDTQAKEYLKSADLNK